MGEYKKPLPLITELSKVFYDGCKENKLFYQKCTDCNEVVDYIPVCINNKCGVEKEVNCDEYCEAVEQGSDATCPVISDPSVITEYNTVLCNC